MLGLIPFDYYSESAIVDVKPDLRGIEKYASRGILVQDFIEKCLEKKPSLRLPTTLLLEHEWFKVFLEQTYEG